MSSEEIRQLRDQLERMEDKIDNLADIRWRVIAHEVIAGALVTFAGLIAAFWALIK